MPVHINQPYHRVFRFLASGIILLALFLPYLAQSLPASRVFAQAAPPAPALIHPTGNAEVRVNQPYLNIRNAAGATNYDYQISTAATFNPPATIVISGTVAPTAANNNITYWRAGGQLNAGSYFWRVRSRQGANQGAWSAAQSFRIANVWSANGETWHWPLDTATTRLSGTFEEAFHAGYFGRLHGGIDVSVCGDAIRAVRNGILRGAAGGTVRLSHAGGQRTKYLHMNALLGLPEGTYVNQGTQLGTAGEVGAPGQCHLHFDLTNDTETVYTNPLSLNFAGWTPPASAAPTVTQIYVRSDRNLNAANKTNISSNTYLIARTVDPAGSAAPPPSGQRLAPYKVEFFVNGTSLHIIQFDTNSNGEHETDYYAYETSNTSRGATPPYLMYYKWDTSSLAEDAGPQTIRIVSSDYDSNSGEREMRIGPELTAAPGSVTIDRCDPKEQTVTVTIQNRNNQIEGNTKDTYELTLKPNGVSATLDKTSVTINDGASDTATLKISGTTAGTVRVVAKSGIVTDIKDAVDINVQVVDGPGCDHSDDNFSAASPQTLTTAPAKVTEPKVAVLFNGFAPAASGFINALKEPNTLINSDFSPDIVADYPILLIPTGGLFGMEHSQFFRARLEEYTRRGGTLIVFDQQHGSEYSVLPGGGLKGYGWSEDNSCFVSSLYLSNYDQVLSGFEKPYLTSNVDGYFTGVPTNSTVLLHRTKNGQPAMVRYPYGNGYVIATTAYDDWGYRNWQNTSDAVVLNRDLLAWAVDPALLPEFDPNKPVSLPVVIENASASMAARVRLSLLAPGKQLISEQTLPITLTAGLSSTITFTTTSAKPLGIWRVDYTLLDASGTVIQTQRAGERFVVKNPHPLTAPAKEVAFAINAPTERFVPGTDGRFTFTLYNNSTVSRTLTVRYGLPHHTWETGDRATYGNFSDLSRTITVAARSQAQFEHIFPMRTNDRLFAYLYEGNSQKDQTWFQTFKASVRATATVTTPQRDYLRGQLVQINVVAKNETDSPATYGLHLFVTDPSGTLVYSGTRSLSFFAHGERNEQFSYLLPNSSQNGSYNIRTELRLGNTPIGGGFGSFVLPESPARIKVTMPAQMPPSTSDPLLVRISNPHSSLPLSGTLGISISDPTGGTSEHTEGYRIPAGGQTVLSFDISSLPLAMGNYRFDFVAADQFSERRWSETKQNTTLTKVDFDRRSYRVRETLGMTVTVRNSGDFDIRPDITLTIADLNYQDAKVASLAIGETVTYSYRLPLPATLTEGRHIVTISVGGSYGSSSNFEFFVPGAQVEPSFGTQTEFDAGETIPVALNNTGGVDAPVTAQLQMFDMRGLVLAEQTIAETIRAGESETISLAIPPGAASGEYVLQLDGRNTVSTTPFSLQRKLIVTGVAATLAVRTEEPSYFGDEEFPGLANIAVQQGSLSNGNLNLRVCSPRQFDEVTPPVETVAALALPDDMPFRSYLYTVGDAVFFSYANGSQLALFSSNGQQIWSGTLNKGRRQLINVPAGTYLAAGSHKFAILSGDPISNGVAGYYASDQEGFGASHELYTWSQASYFSPYERFIVFAYHDNTRVTVADADTGQQIWTGTLNDGQRWESNTLHRRWLHITADQPVSAYTYYDQGSLVPAADGRWSGMRFYTYAGSVGFWQNDLNVIAFEDDTEITIKNTDSGEVYWSGTLGSGQIRSEAFGGRTSRGAAYITVTSSKRVAVTVAPFIGYTSSYHQGFYAPDATGSRIGTDLIAPMLSGGIMQVFAYSDDTTIQIYNSRTNQLVNTITLDAGQSTNAISGYGLWRLRSDKPISSWAGWGEFSAEFAPVLFGKIVYQPPPYDRCRFVLWETNVPVSTTSTLAINELVPSLNVTGRFLLDGRLYANTNQLLAEDYQSFYLFDRDTQLTLETDRDFYRPGDTISASGQISNTSAQTLTTVLIVKSDTDELLNRPLTLAPGESYRYSANLTATENFTLTATADALEVNKPIFVGRAELSARLNAPDVAGRLPFVAAVTVSNTGPVSATVQVSLAGATAQTLTIQPKSSARIERVLSITKDTTISAVITGDLVQNLTKQVRLGEDADFFFDTDWLYPAGPIEVPYTIRNSGEVPVNFETTVALIDQQGTTIAQYTIPTDLLRGEQEDDTLKLGNLSPGSYDLRATSRFGTTWAYFTVVAREKITLNAWSYPGDGIMNVSAWLYNEGFTSFSGQLLLHSDFYTSSVQINNLQRLDSTSALFQFDVQQLPSGIYTATLELQDTTGQRVNQAQVTFELRAPQISISSLPSNLTLPVSTTATLSFELTNYGNKAGEGRIHLSFSDVVDEEQSIWLPGGTSGTVDFTFFVPPELEAKTYQATYLFQEQQGVLPLTIEGVAIGVTPSLDRDGYGQGDTAQVSLRIEELADRPTLPMLARVRFNDYDQVQPFALAASGTTTVTFNVPVSFLGDEKVFYGIYDTASERSIHLNTLYLPRLNDSVTVVTDRQIYRPGETVHATVITSITGQLDVKAPGYSQRIPLNGSNTAFSFQLPMPMARGTYSIDYIPRGCNCADEGKTLRTPFDVAAPKVRVTDARLDKPSYQPGDTPNLSLIVASDQAVEAVLQTWIERPHSTALAGPTQTVQIDASPINQLYASQDLDTDQSGVHMMRYRLVDPANPHVVYGAGAEAFDVGHAVVTAVHSDRDEYPAGGAVQATTTLYAIGPISGTLQLFVDGTLAVNRPVTLAKGFQDVQNNLGNAFTGGKHQLRAVLLYNDLSSERSTSFDYGIDRPDLIVQPAFVPSGQVISRTVELLVVNTGNSRSDTTTVALYNGDPASGGTLVGTASVPALAANSSTIAQITWSTAGQGGQQVTLYAHVDPQNQVIERREDNNLSRRAVQLPALSHQLHLDQPLYYRSDTANIQGQLLNLQASATLRDLRVETVVQVLLDSDEGSTGASVFSDTRTLAVLPANGQVEIVIPWRIRDSTTDLQGEFLVTQTLSGPGVPETAAQAKLLLGEIQTQIVADEPNGPNGEYVDIIPSIALIASGDATIRYRWDDQPEADAPPQFSGLLGTHTLYAHPERDGIAVGYEISRTFQVIRTATPTPTNTPTHTPTTTPTYTPSSTPTLPPTITPAITPTPTCVPVRAPLDIVLVLDRSDSMKGEPIARTKEAAKTFVNHMNLTTDQVAIVSFSDYVNLDQALTRNASAAEAAIDRLSAAGATRIDLGISRAHTELRSSRRNPMAIPVIILLSDGVSPEGAAITAADSAKADGVRLLTIGLGSATNPRLLQHIASSDGDYYVAPAPSDLHAIYMAISHAIGCGSTITPPDPRAAELVRSGSVASGTISLSVVGKFQLDFSAEGAWQPTRWFDRAIDTEQDLANKGGQSRNYNVLHEPAEFQIDNKWYSLEHAQDASISILHESPLHVALRTQYYLRPNNSNFLVQTDYTIYVSGRVAVDMTVQNLSTSSRTLSRLEYGFVTLEELGWSISKLSSNRAIGFRRTSGPAPRSNLLIVNHSADTLISQDSDFNRYWYLTNQNLAPQASLKRSWELQLTPGGQNTTTLTARANDLRAAQLVVEQGGSITGNGYDAKRAAYVVQASDESLRFYPTASQARHTPVFIIDNWTSTSWQIRRNGVLLASNSQPRGSTALASYDPANQRLVVQYLADIPTTATTAERTFSVSTGTP